MATYYPEYPQQEPLIKECLPEQTLQLAAKTSLLGIWIIWLKSRPAFIPKRWKSWGQTTGYLLYETDLELDAEEERLRIIDGRDRVQIYLDDQHVATQYQTEIGEDLLSKEKKAVTNLKILLGEYGPCQLVTSS